MAVIKVGAIGLFAVVGLWLSGLSFESLAVDKQTSSGGLLAATAFAILAVRYVERNALRANMVEEADGWPWSSLWYCTLPQLPCRFRPGRDPALLRQNQDQAEADGALPGASLPFRTEG